MKLVFRLLGFCMLLLTGCNRDTSIYTSALPDKAYSHDKNWNYKGYNPEMSRDFYWRYEREYQSSLKLSSQQKSKGEGEVKNQEKN